MSTATLVYLKRAMVVRNLTISELAARSGVSRDTIGGAVRGKPISERSLAALVKALDLVAVHPLMHELGVEVAEEAPAQVGGPGG